MIKSVEIQICKMLTGQITYGQSYCTSICLFTAVNNATKQINHFFIFYSAFKD